MTDAGFSDILPTKPSPVAALVNPLPVLESFEYSSNSADALHSCFASSPFKLEANPLVDESKLSSHVQLLGISNLDGTPCSMLNVPRHVPVRIELFVPNTSTIPKGPISLCRFLAPLNGSKTYENDYKSQHQKGQRIAVFDLTSATSSDAETGSIFRNGSYLTILWRAGWRASGPLEPGTNKQAVALRLIWEKNCPTWRTADDSEERKRAQNMSTCSFIGRPDGQYLGTCLLSEEMRAPTKEEADKATNLDPDFITASFKALEKDANSFLALILYVLLLIPHALISLVVGLIGRLFEFTLVIAIICPMAFCSGFCGKNSLMTSAQLVVDLICRIPFGFLSLDESVQSE